MKLLWLDLETTGLNPIKHSVLEIAIAQATLENPFEIGAMYTRVLHRQEEIALDPFILNMHTKNGLLDECSSGILPHFVEHELLALTVAPPTRDDLYVLAGNSVHFDLGFVRSHFPEFAKRLSHRVYDVTAITLFCQSLGMPRPPKAEAHRAVADVYESIALAKSCRDWLGAR